MRSDLTARASIRNAALQLFAEHGPDAVSVRQIAEQAAVSPGLVLHHYGSKAGLREAVDTHVATLLDDLLDPDQEQGIAKQLAAHGESWSFADMFTQVFPPDSPLPAYLRRLLLAGDPAGERLFRRWYEVTASLLETMHDQGVLQPSDDPPIRAAFLLANDLALILLRPQLTSVLGTDPLTPEGMGRWTQEVLNLYRDGLVAPSTDPRSSEHPHDEHPENTEERSDGRAE